jgi:hypothetical protein
MKTIFGEALSGFWVLADFSIGPESSSGGLDSL